MRAGCALLGIYQQIPLQKQLFLLHNQLLLLDLLLLLALFSGIEVVDVLLQALLVVRAVRACHRELLQWEQTVQVLHLPHQNLMTRRF